MRILLRVAAALLVVVVAIGPFAGRGIAAAAAERPNVVLILVDTLRADHLGIYGYARPTSPNLDRFFAGGVVFESARSQAACTFPSANSLLTSRDALEFVGRPHGEFGIPAGFRSIAELLQPAGYGTIAVSASPIVRKSPSPHNRVGGFQRGFDVFDETCQWGQARCVNARALEHLEGAPRPFFLYLHYMEPHDPYAPPKEFGRRFARPYDGRAFISAGSPNPLVAFLYGWDAKVPQDYPPFDPKDLAARDLEHLVDLYDDEIAYFDQELGELLRRLAERGVLDHTVVALVSDHGEQFLEHGHIKHCLGSLHDEAIRTPLLVRGPGVSAGRRVKRPVANLDVVPTLLDYAGGSADGVELEGHSLRPLAAGDGRDSGLREPRYVFSTQGKFHSATDGRMKFMIDIESWERSLFDLASDPGERTNLAAEREEEVARLTGVLREWVDRVSGKKSAAERLRNADAVEERLRALGYLP
jgi:arylsulfatase A-like enzyme